MGIQGRAVFGPVRCHQRTCDDAEAIAEACLHWHLEIAQMRPGALSGVIALAQGDHVQLGYGVFSGQFRSRGEIPRGCVSLILAGGRMPPISQGRPIQALDVELLEDTRSIDYANTGDCGVFAISIERSQFEQTARTCGYAPEALRAGRLKLRGLRERRQLHLRLLRRLRAAQRWPLLLKDATMRPLWEQAIVRDLFAAAVPVSEAPPLPQRSRLAALAEEHMRANEYRPMSVLELAATIGTSERALYLGFQERFGMSPVAYARAMRLNAAYRELRRGDAATTITDVALRWGFVHLGRFAIDYRAFFGESPSDTLLRCTGATAAPRRPLRERPPARHQTAA